MIFPPAFNRRRNLRRASGESREFRSLVLLRFILSLGIALPVYINSTYLAGYAGEQAVGLLFSASSVLAVLAFFAMPKFLTTFGNYALLFLMIFFLALASFELATLTAPFVIFLLFIPYKTITSSISFPVDAFIEKHSDDRNTGKTRGIFLTLSILAFLLAPLIVGSLLENGDYWKIYLLSTGLLAFALVILFFGFRHYHDPQYVRTPFREVLRRFLDNRDIRTIFWAAVLLRSFIAFMIIYAPLYLHEHVGFGWGEISLILTAMLVPGVLLTVPIGKLADERFGEKELLIVGFIIAGTAIMMLPFIEGSWSAFLITIVTAHVGSTLIEITSESYFFKHVEETDTDMIGFFRNARPIAYFVVPLSASLLLLIMPLSYVFFTVGATLLLLGIPIGLRLRDTR
jgi:MFS family permease